MRWLHFILSHSIFISFCAVALCYQTYTLLSLPSNNFVYLLVFSSTLCSYNAYWILSKFYFNAEVSFFRFIALHLSNVLLFVLSSLAVLLCLFYVPEVLKFVLIAGLLTVLYTLPLWPGKWIRPAQYFGFIKTFLLALTWTYVTIVLPAKLKFDELDQTFVLLFTARLLFMLMLCAIFDSRDSAVDKVRGLKSLATDVSKRALHVIMLISFTLYIIAGIALRYQLHSVEQTLAFIATGALVFMIYILSLKKQGYIFYYFIVDGLMLFSALATFVAANV